ncbi:hypothetical protein [Sphingomonas radiodurans]|uniref:hypothetical protein n=1 Tax=Sphingomonas radiodurans TaxID=2890321 RepID=UPI001E3C75F5|nr:hypothetical protein [Sphingomonas radiodurans]WBH16348.1 hypothetical protein LLW23_16365 [Sphingomonas radiodurans]
MGEIERSVPAGTIEQWVMHLRRQRSRASDQIWLIEQGYTVHDGRNGIPTRDATLRVLGEQKAVVEEVTALLRLYDDLNLPGVNVEF